MRHEKAENTAEKPDETVAKSENSGIMKTRDVSGLEQAKKRDRKIFITESAINKVDFVKPKDFSEAQASLMMSKNKELLNVAKNPFAVSIIANAKRQSLVYLHNHPSTNTFSIGDIDTFVCERAIKAISVVTNQGEVYILNKLDNYSFDGTRKLLTEIYNSYPEGEIDDKDFVKKFLRRCREGGIEYAKSK